MARPRLRTLRSRVPITRTTANQNRENYNATRAIGSLSVLRVCTATETVGTGFPLTVFGTGTPTGTPGSSTLMSDWRPLGVIGSSSSASLSSVVWPPDPTAGVAALPSTSPTSCASWTCSEATLPSSLTRAGRCHARRAAACANLWRWCVRSSV